MAKRPNILFLFSDEHSFRFLGCLPRERGGEPVETPALDQLAMGGTIFTNAYCQMPLCTPSRLCTLTGRHVMSAGAWGNGSMLKPELPTIPGTLAEAGYATCLVGKMHLGGNRQFVGFQHRPYGDLTGATGHQWEPLEREDRNSMRARTNGAGTTDLPESLIQDQVVAQETLAFIREQTAAKPDQPWFLCASFSRPHFPLTAPRRWYDSYWPDGVTEPFVPPGGDAYDHPMSVGLRQGFQTDAINHDEMMRARAGYFACVSYLDEVIGDLLLRLDNDGLLDNTLIVYTTDHGELAGEHGAWWKNGWYEGCTHIPLIISTPAQRRGERAATTCNTPVGLIDLFPSFCAAAGIDPPTGLEGENLLPVINGDGPLPRRAIACDVLNPRWGDGTEFRLLRLGDYKYVRFRDAPPLLFNVKTDPGEQHNLINSPEPADREAREELADLAGQLDFDAAAAQYQDDRELARRHSLPDVEGATGNLYLLPTGKLVNAEDALYHPHVITHTPSSFFADYPTNP